MSNENRQAHARSLMPIFTVGHGDTEGHGGLGQDWWDGQAGTREGSSVVAPKVALAPRTGAISAYGADQSDGREDGDRDGTCGDGPPGTVRAGWLSDRARPAAP